MPDIQIDATGDEDDEALAAHAAEAARAQAQSGDLHPATADLVDRFAAALHDKLLTAQRKYGYSDNWQRDDWMDECREHLRQHLQKGDPRDVAAYCAFLWHHGAPTVANKSLTQLRAECEAAAPQQAAQDASNPLKGWIFDKVDMGRGDERYICTPDGANATTVSNESTSDHRERMLWLIADAMAKESGR